MSVDRVSVSLKARQIIDKLREKHFINLPLTKMALKMYEKGCKQGLENFDDSGVIRLLEKKAVN